MGFVMLDKQKQCYFRDNVPNFDHPKSNIVRRTVELSPATGEESNGNGVDPNLGMFVLRHIYIATYIAAVGFFKKMDDDVSFQMMWPVAESRKG